MRMIVAVTVVGLLAISAFAQDIPKPGPEHEMLKKKEGAWTTTMKVGDKETKSAMLQ